MSPEEYEIGKETARIEATRRCIADDKPNYWPWWMKRIFCTYLSQWLQHDTQQPMQGKKKEQKGMEERKKSGEMRLHNNGPRWKTWRRNCAVRRTGRDLREIKWIEERRFVSPAAAELMVRWNADWNGMPAVLLLSSSVWCVQCIYVYIFRLVYTYSLLLFTQDADTHRAGLAVCALQQKKKRAARSSVYTVLSKTMNRYLRASKVSILSTFPSFFQVSLLKRGSYRSLYPSLWRHGDDGGGVTGEEPAASGIETSHPYYRNSAGKKAK